MNRTTRNTLAALTAALLLAPLAALRAPPASAAEPTSFGEASPAEQLEQQFANPPTQARLARLLVVAQRQRHQASHYERPGMDETHRHGRRPRVRRGRSDTGRAQRGTDGPVFRFAGMAGIVPAHAREADRLGLEIGLNIQSGWNLGGPMVTPDKAAKIIAWSRLQVRGPTNLAVALPKPKADFYRDSFVLAYRLKRDANGKPPTVRAPTRPIRQLKQKCAYFEFGVSAADCRPCSKTIRPRRARKTCGQKMCST